MKFNWKRKERSFIMMRLTLNDFITTLSSTRKLITRAILVYETDASRIDWINLALPATILDRIGRWSSSNISSISLRFQIS